MLNMREVMMDEVIKKYGFESEETIQFCKLCELSCTIGEVTRCYINLMM